MPRKETSIEEQIEFVRELFDNDYGDAHILPDGMVLFIGPDYDGGVDVRIASMDHIRAINEAASHFVPDDRVVDATDGIATDYYFEDLGSFAWSMTTDYARFTYKLLRDGED